MATFEKITYPFPTFDPIPASLKNEKSHLETHQKQPSEKNIGDFFRDKRELNFDTPLNVPLPAEVSRLEDQNVHLDFSYP